MKLARDDNSIWASIIVSNIQEAINTYVNKWNLFQIINHFRLNDDEFATLSLKSELANFKLAIYTKEQTDNLNRVIPAARNACFSFPKSDFWNWFNINFGNHEMIESTPWSDAVVLRDEYGHMFTVYTTEDHPQNGQ